MSDSTLVSVPHAEIRYEARLSAEQELRLAECIAVVREAQRKSLEAALALAAIKRERLYVRDGNFSSFARKHFGYGSSRAYQLASAGELYAEMEAAGVSPLPTNEAQLRPLVQLPKLDDQHAAWARALKASGGGAAAVTMEAVEHEVKAGQDTPAAEVAPAAAECEPDPADQPLTEADAKAWAMRFGRDADHVVDVAGSIARGAPLTSAVLEEAAEAYRETLTEDGASQLPFLVENWGLLGEEPPEVEKSEDGKNALLLSVPATYYRDSPPGAPTVLVPQEAVEAGVRKPLDRALIDELRDATAHLGYAPTFNRTNEHVDWAWWTWNPLTGCAQGCGFCYARDIANRFYPQGFAETFYPGRLNAPANSRVPKEAETNPWAKNVFTVSMGDLFRASVSDAIIQAVLDEIAAHPEWDFLLLTKFAKRLPHFEFPDNAWVGTSIVDQSWVRPAEKAFAEVRAKVKWISAEPLLSSLEFERLDLWDWIVIGAQSRSSGAPAFQPNQMWVARLKEQARSAGLRIYEKENLNVHLKEFPELGKPLSS